MTENRTSLLIFNATMALLLATPIATALSRNAAFPLLLLCALLLAIAVGLQSDAPKKLLDVARRIFRLRSNAPATAIALASILFALLSLFWSPDVIRGLGAIAGASTAALVGIFCCVLVARHATIPDWLMWALPLAISLGCLLIVSELTFGSPVRGALGASTEVFRLNRAAVAVALMLPLLFFFESNKTRLFSNLVVIVIVSFAVYKSDSESAKLAVIVVIVALLLSQAMTARNLVFFCGFGILATHVLAPLIVVGLHTFAPKEFIEDNVRILVQHFIRLEIWWAYTHQIMENALLGHGVQASTRANEFYGGTDPSMLYALSFGHPHNASIQTWYELGLVGITLSTALIVVLLRQILRLPDRQQKIATVLMLAVWSVAYVSHGALQHWWWALVGIIAVFFSALRNQSASQF